MWIPSPVHYGQPEHDSEQEAQIERSERENELCIQSPVPSVGGEKSSGGNAPRRTCFSREACNLCGVVGNQL